MFNLIHAANSSCLLVHCQLQKAVMSAYLTLQKNKVMLFFFALGFMQSWCIFNDFTIFSKFFNIPAFFFGYFWSLISKCHTYKKPLQPTIENMELPSQRTKEMKNCRYIERPKCLWLENLKNLECYHYIRLKQKAARGWIF